MRDERLRAITLEDVQGEQRELADLIGLEAYIRLVDCYGGSHIYIVKPETLLRVDRDSAIKQDFNGANYRELAQKYGLTERYIRQILYDELERFRRIPLDDQLGFPEIFL